MWSPRPESPACTALASGSAHVRRAVPVVTVRQTLGEVAVVASTVVDSSRTYVRVTASPCSCSPQLASLLPEEVAGGPGRDASFAQWRVVPGRFHRVLVEAGAEGGRQCVAALAEHTDRDTGDRS